MTPEGYYPRGTDLSYKPTTHEEERELFRKAKSGDSSAREFLITNHLLFAAMQGRKWGYGKLTEEEAVSAANLALMKAVDNFDQTRPTRFTSYLRPFIRGELATLWRSKNVMGEHAPKFPEREESNEFVSHVLSDGGTEPHPFEEEDHNKFVRQLLEEAKHTLSEVEAEIIRRHYCEDGESLADIGLERGLTRSRIQQIKDAAVKKLRLEMKRQMAKAKVEL